MLPYIIQAGGQHVDDHTDADRQLQIKLTFILMAVTNKISIDNMYCLFHI